eukprot:CAMPEP_0177627362 /NCGR_PEP_ID=MMETSP0419_2-20121207/31162_1 /TAXON_ID=582737 /ORGANISM="Tetraselmis sp., Strain GSL018" /LENGTH=178 /DNA_ID=CAMNT_0019128509 /DNA_START=107 /DNA_END=638 /DNA_ORIENTATION=+
MRGAGWRLRRRRRASALHVPKAEGGRERAPSLAAQPRELHRRPRSRANSRSRARALLPCLLVQLPMCPLHRIFFQAPAHVLPNLLACRQLLSDHLEAPLRSFSLSIWIALLCLALSAAEVGALLLADDALELFNVLLRPHQLPLELPDTLLELLLLELLCKHSALEGRHLARVLLELG